MTYEERLEITRARLDDALFHAKTPVTWCSFGRKSLVIVDLIHDLGHKVPVMWMRHADPQGARREKFREIVRHYDLEVLDYWPTDYGFLRRDETMNLVKFFDLGKREEFRDLIPVIFPLQRGKLEDWKCIFKVVDERRHEPYPYAWDISFFGGNEADDGTRGNTLVYFPLREWTTEDIDRYTEEQDVPPSFDLKNYPICCACIDPDCRTSQVFCPLLNAEIDWIDIGKRERFPFVSNG
jgi:hypothetical protein